MSLPEPILLANTFRQWVNSYNTLLTHVDNTAVYILAAQNATPRTTTGNIALNGTMTTETLLVGNTSANGSLSNTTLLVINTTANTTIMPGLVNVGGLTINTTTVFVGNAVSNTTISSGQIQINGTTLSIFDPIVAAIALG